MDKRSELTKQELSVRIEVEKKRSYVPPKVTRLSPFRSTFGGRNPNKENVPTSNNFGSI